MDSVLQKISNSYKKSAVVNVRSGDTVKVHQKIKEGSKERVQVFQGLVIRTDQKNSHLSRITVRRIASGIGVEKSFLLHSPLVVKVEVVKRSKVRRNYLSYMRQRTGKSARLSGIDFDRNAVNDLPEEKLEAESLQTAEVVPKIEVKETEVAAK
jgi:large subunit ribosomal protein L19